MSNFPALSGLRILRDVPLSEYTRFHIGGPAEIYAETSEEAVFMEALLNAQSSGAPWVVIGQGTNLIVSDRGFPGIVLRLINSGLRAEGESVYAAAGTVLQTLVDYSVEAGLAGIHTMTGIPGSTGAAIYGNAGAYGRAISQSVREVRFFDGHDIRTVTNAECQFRYRESVFKRNKNWIVFSAILDLERGDAAQLRQHAAGILETRNRKYPPTMKCAGSIFKNLLLAELPTTVRAQVPERVIIEGKVPSAYFLEQVGAKGMHDGGIRVADYHANLIFNEGQGTAAQLCQIINELKRRVADQFGFEIEEEVQYVGFGAA